MSAKKAEACFASMLMLFGLWVVMQSYGYGILGPNVTEPGFFPLLAGLLLTGSAAGVLLKVLREGTQVEALSYTALLPVLGSAAVIAAYVALIDLLGMVLLAPLYIFLMSWLIERPKSLSDALRLGVIAILFTAFAYVLFGYLLRVPLPRGMLGF